MNDTENTNIDEWEYNVDYYSNYDGGITILNNYKQYGKDIINLISKYSKVCFCYSRQYKSNEIMNTFNYMPNHIKNIEYNRNSKMSKYLPIILYKLSISVNDYIYHNMDYMPINIQKYEVIDYTYFAHIDFDLHMKPTQIIKSVQNNINKFPNIAININSLKINNYNIIEITNRFDTSMIIDLYANLPYMKQKLKNRYNLRNLEPVKYDKF